ncbi:MAG: hypothetical protein EPGJADBJ_01177 [Saprospiraceae bacterium]|nr:hypothetical protein [Saprospiraceae bacterium]
MINKRISKVLALCLSTITIFSLWLLLTTSSCEKKPSLKETSGFDTTLVWRIARYERAFADAPIYDTSFFFSEGHFKKYFPDLGLTVRMFAWGGEVGGPWCRILHFKSDSIGVEQAFGFYDEYCFNWRRCSADECLRQIAIGRQLTELSRDFGFQNDSIKLNRLLTITMDSVLAFREITAADTNSLKDAHLKSGLVTNYPGQGACTSENIKKTMQSIVTDIRTHKARFFRGELTGGIWRVEVKSTWRPKGTWEFEVSYLNHECAHILWM